MIAFDRVSKAFGKRRALDAVSLEVRHGEILALLGHNGAGKSTLFALALGLLRMTGGDIVVREVSVRRDPRRAREGIGSVLAPAFYGYLSGWDNLRALTCYSGDVSPAEISAVVDLVGLDDRIHDRVREYSHGMRRRLALAQALLPRPQLLLLDEWETGLDPEGTHAMEQVIRDLNREHGVTVIVASHQLAGARRLADRCAILREGRLVFSGGWEEIDHGPVTVRLELDDWTQAASVLDAARARILGDGLVELGSGSSVPEVVAALAQASVGVHAVERQRLTLDDYYRRTARVARP